MIRVELNLGSELLLGGEVSRVDVNRRGGYAAIWLDPPPEGWREQLRMPCSKALWRGGTVERNGTSRWVFRIQTVVGPWWRRIPARDLLNAAEEARTLAVRVAAVWRRP